jgi:hypothetical protein
LHTSLSSSAPAQLVARIAMEVAGQTPASAMLHVEWFERFQQHQRQKKQLLARWKEVKARRQRELAAVDADLADKEAAEAEQQKQMYVRHSSLRCCSVCQCQTHSLMPWFCWLFFCFDCLCVRFSQEQQAAERAEKAAAVAAWKARKAARAEQAAALQKAQEQEREMAAREKQEEERVRHSHVCTDICATRPTERNSEDFLFFAAGSSLSCCSFV